MVEVTYTSFRDLVAGNDLANGRDPGQPRLVKGLVASTKVTHAAI